MEHNVILSTRQIKFLLDVLNEQDLYEDEEDVEVVLEDAVEDSWFAPGGDIYETCKNLGTL